MNNLIRFELGDWSYDGHNMTESIIVRSNYDTDKIKDLLQKRVTALLGIDFDKECEEYEQNTLSEDTFDILNTLGILKAAFPDTTVQQDEGLGAIEFLKIMLATAKYVDQEFEYEVVELPTVYGYGYGLFS